MGSFETERILSVIYLLSAVASLVSLISSAVVFANWSSTLNYPCINDVSDGVGRDGYGLGVFAAGDCGCIFYGKAMAVTSNNNYGFQGGHTAICHFIIFSPIPVFVIALILGLYHTYRICIVIPRRSRKIQRAMIRNASQPNLDSADEDMSEERSLKKRVRGRSPQRRRIDIVKKRSRSASPARRPRSAALNAVVVSKSIAVRSDPLIGEDSFACWAPVAVVASVVTLLALSTAVVATDGYARTCSQWRRVALRMLSANGDLARVLTTRISCSAIYDFMDYLQPRKVIRYGFAYEYGGAPPGRTVQEGETTIIDTAISLIFAIAAAYFNVMCWVILVVFNSIMAINRRKMIKAQRIERGTLCCVCCK